MPKSLGFVGSLLLIFLFAVLIFLMFNIASQMRHRFSQLTISGFAFALSIYVIVNLAMVMGLAPVVGVPLPFISYGGTSLLAFMAGLGDYFSDGAPANGGFAEIGDKNV